MSGLASFGRKIRAAAAQLAAAREIRLELHNDSVFVEGTDDQVGTVTEVTPEPPPLFGHCPTCGQALKAPLLPVEIPSGENPEV